MKRINNLKYVIERKNVYDIIKLKNNGDKIMDMSVQMSESYVVALLLTFVGGYFDAYTYICRNHVFANAQTGNMVMMGISLFSDKPINVGIYLAPIITFAVGIIAVEYIREHHNKKVLHWRQYIVLIEVVIVILVGFIPLGRFNVFANILVSFICALQANSFKKTKGLVFVTTMCTGNLNKATSNLYDYIKTKDTKYIQQSLYYYGVIVVFIFGALSGGTITKLIGQYGIMVTAIFLIAVFLLMKSNIEEDRNINGTKD